MAVATLTSKTISASGRQLIIVWTAPTNWGVVSTGLDTPSLSNGIAGELVSAVASTVTVTATFNLSGVANKGEGLTVSGLGQGYVSGGTHESAAVSASAVTNNSEVMSKKKKLVLGLLRK
jgi:hypothetical protein